MKAIRKINNNVAVCQDAGGSELIAFGKGIGFPAMPYEIENLDVIDRTFYDLNPSQV
ncbi:CAT RNA binding domain-containing protein, partial [uncultured Faecalibaculum sp.]